MTNSIGNLLGLPEAAKNGIRDGSVHVNIFETIEPNQVQAIKDVCADLNLDVAFKVDGTLGWTCTITSKRR